MPDLSTAPDSIHRLMRWLCSNEFRVDAERIDGVNHQLVTYRSPSLVVQLAVDRGDWCVTLATNEMSELHTVDGWRAWAYGQPLAGDPSALDEQIDFVVTEWLVQAKEAQANARRAEETIRSLEEDWVYRRIGWRPSE